MKAYEITYGAGDATTVRFASHAVVARREGANELDADFQDVSCRRAAIFDDYSPGPVPNQAMLDAGWFFECSRCWPNKVMKEYGGIIYNGNPVCERCCASINWPWRVMSIG